MIVVDASLMVAWLLQEDDIRIAPDIYESLPELDIIVPPHWPVEVANALLTSVRRRRLVIEDIETILESLSIFRISFDETLTIDQMSVLTLFAASQNLTVYDASYVHLALEENVALATLDTAMRVAAQSLNIPLIPRV